MHRYLRAGRALALAGLILGGAASLPVAIAPPASAATHTYSWSITCDGNGSCNASWNWTQNGTVIPNPGGSVLYNSQSSCPFSTCSDSSSNYPTIQWVQPDTANGLTATLQVCAPSTGGRQCDTQTSTQSFAPGSSVSVSLSASAKGKVDNICSPGYPCHGSTPTSETATFTLKS